MSSGGHRGIIFRDNRGIIHWVNGNWLGGFPCGQVFIGNFVLRVWWFLHLFLQLGSSLKKDYKFRDSAITECLKSIAEFHLKWSRNRDWEMPIFWSRNSDRGLPIFGSCANHCECQVILCGNVQKRLLSTRPWRDRERTRSSRSKFKLVWHQFSTVQFPSH